MNIQEEIDKLKQQKQEIADAIADNIERKKKLEATIKKLENMFGKAQELLEDSPVIEPTKTLDLRNGSYY